MKMWTDRGTDGRRTHQSNRRVGYTQPKNSRKLKNKWLPRQQFLQVVD